MKLNFKRDKIFKYLAAIFLIVIVVFGGYYLGNRPEKYEIQAITLFDVVCEKEADVFLQFPFWTLTNKNYEFDKLEYIVGDDVQIFGENVDQLYNSKLIVRKYNLRETVRSDKDFYSSIVHISDTVEEGEPLVYTKKYNKSLSARVRKAKRMLKPYVNSGEIIQMNLVSHQEISRDVKVDSIRLGDFQFDFGLFTIKTAEYLNKNDLELSDVITLTSMVGYGEFSHNPSALDYYLGLEALEDIKSIEAYNLRGYTDLSSFRDIGGVKKENIQKNKRGTASFEFGFNAKQYPENLHNYDVMANSILVDITLENGEKLSFDNIFFVARVKERILYRLYDKIR